MDTYLHTYKEKDAWSYGCVYGTMVWRSIVAKYDHQKVGLEVWKESGTISSNYYLILFLPLGYLSLGAIFQKCI